MIHLKYEWPLKIFLNENFREIFQEYCLNYRCYVKSAEKSIFHSAQLIITNRRNYSAIIMPHPPLPTAGSSRHSRMSPVSALLYIGAIVSSLRAAITSRSSSDDRNNHTPISGAFARMKGRISSEMQGQWSDRRCRR